MSQTGATTSGTTQPDPPKPPKPAPLVTYNKFGRWEPTPVDDFEDPEYREIFANLEKETLAKAKAEANKGAPAAAAKAPASKFLAPSAGAAPGAPGATPAAPVTQKAQPVGKPVAKPTWPPKVGDDDDDDDFDDDDELDSGSATGLPAGFTSLKELSSTDIYRQKDPRKDDKFRKATVLLSTADQASDNGNYKAASNMYKKAYTFFRKVKGTNSAEYANLLHKYGDCLFHLDNMREAVKYYDEHWQLYEHSDIVAQPLKIVVLLKKGKTLHKLKRDQESEAAYKNAILLTNAALSVRHPLYTVVYNTYIESLKANDAPEAAIARVEKEYNTKMAKSSSVVAIPEDLQQELSAWTSNETHAERMEKRRQLRLSRQMFAQDKVTGRDRVDKMSKSPTSKMAIIIAIVVLVFGSGGATVMLAMRLLNGDSDKPAAKHPVDSKLRRFVGRVYTSADGFKKMQITDNGTVKLTYGDDHKVPSCYSGKAPTGLDHQIKQFFEGKEAYVFKQVAGGFKDQDGTVFYPEEGKTGKVISKMKDLAELAQDYYRTHKRYPKSRNQFTGLGREVNLDNPLGGGMKPIVNAHEFEKYEGDAAFNEQLEKMRAGAALFKPDGKPDIPGGLIECMSIRPFAEYHTEDGIAFIVRGYDEFGNFISSSQPGKLFVVVQKNGTSWSAARSEAIKAPFSDSSRTTIYIDLSKEYDD